VLVANQLKAETALFNEDKVELREVCNQVEFSFQIAQLFDFVYKLQFLDKGLTAFIGNGENRLNPGAFRIT